MWQRVEAESVNQEVSWIWVSLLLWLQLVHHRLQLMVAVNCVCEVEPGVPEEFSKHLGTHFCCFFSGRGLL